MMKTSARSVGDRVRRLVLAMAALMVAAPAWAGPISLWRGEFRFTVTRMETAVDGDAGVPPLPTVPALSLGDTFEGHYSYLSPTIDGIFRASRTPYEGEGLIESFFAPLPSPFDTDIGPFCAFYAAGGECGAEEPRLTIAGGQVTSFDWSSQFGALISGFYGPQESAGILRNTWKYRIDADNRTYRAWGTLDVQNPQRVPEPGTLFLFGISLAALGLGRHRFSLGRHLRVRAKGPGPNA